MVARVAGGKGYKGGKGKNKQWQASGKGFRSVTNYNQGPYDRSPNSQPGGKNWSKDSPSGGKNGFSGGKSGNLGGKGWNAGGKSGNQGGKGWNSGGKNWR